MIFGFISIHAARVGCDQSNMFMIMYKKISIHAARVGCDIRHNLNSVYMLRISIHAARVGCDLKQFPAVHPKHDFNPRSPSGLRQNSKVKKTFKKKFQSTQPEWAATLPSICMSQPSSLFQSTQPEWAATLRGTISK